VDRHPVPATPAPGADDPSLIDPHQDQDPRAPHACEPQQHDDHGRPPSRNYAEAKRSAWEVFYQLRTGGDQSTDEQIYELLVRRKQLRIHYVPRDDVLGIIRAANAMWERVPRRAGDGR
jgi:hypothetical protein